MDHIFIQYLNKKQHEDIVDFYNSSSIISIEQYPGWAEINNPQKGILYYLCYENEILAGYAVIIEKYKIATINYGPVCINQNQLINCIIEIYNFYSEKKFAKILLKPKYTEQTDAENIELMLNEKLKFIKSGKDNDNWSTIRINLLKSIEEIRTGYSQNHKRSIKKASSLGLVIEKINDLNTVDKLSSIYNHLYTNRKLVKSFKNTHEVFSKIWNFFNLHQNGDFWGVYLNQQLIGGLILIKQKETIFYQYGASDNNYKKIPILHMAFDHVIEYYKNENFQYFDLGGFPLNVEETDQIYAINRFKKGFGGEIINYPPCISIIINKKLEIVLESAKKIRNKLFR